MPCTRFTGRFCSLHVLADGFNDGRLHYAASPPIIRAVFAIPRSAGAAVPRSAAVLIVANWSMSSIPRAIGMDAVRQLLASINRRTAMGRRDYAILLLSRLGLRSSEVAFLELDGIDWKAGQLSVRGKSGQRSDL